MTDQSKPIIYCQVTGSLCGTDTWAVGYECQCGACQAWLYIARVERAFLDAARFIPTDQTIELNADTNRLTLELVQRERRHG